MIGVRHEFKFTREIPIDELFDLMVKNRGSFAGWKFEHDPGTYSIEWSPTILINIWKMHPKVIAMLKKETEEQTTCTVVTTNKNLIDPFKLIKRTHEQSYTKLFGHILELTREYEKN